MSLSAVAPLVTFPTRPEGFQVIDYHGRNSAAVQAACRRLLLPLPVDAAAMSRFEAPRSLVSGLGTLDGEQRALLPPFQPGVGLLQPRRDRACIQRMHGELQPTSLAFGRQLPLFDLAKCLAPPAELAAFAPPPEAYIAVRQPVCSVLRFLPAIEPHLEFPETKCLVLDHRDVCYDAGFSSLRGVR